MSVIYVLVVLALLLVGAAVWAFAWAVRRGEMDDLETPAIRIVFDEEPRRRE
jgi:cbb3-type cytochrome oxidase maturation protein